MSVEEIAQRMQTRLEEVLEASDRLRAAIEALGATDPGSEPANAVPGAAPARIPRPHRAARRRTRPTNDPQVRNGQTSAAIASIPTPATIARDQSPPASPRDRALTELRRELTAGLRTTYATRPVA